jgi:hypothetical protein
MTAPRRQTPSRPVSLFLPRAGRGPRREARRRRAFAGHRAHYSIGLTNWASLSFDDQFIANPGYNMVRGPSDIGAVRLHVMF